MEQPPDLPGVLGVTATVALLAVDALLTSPELEAAELVKGRGVLGVTATDALLAVLAVPVDALLKSSEFKAAELVKGPGVEAVEQLAEVSRIGLVTRATDCGLSEAAAAVSCVRFDSTVKGWRLQTGLVLDLSTAVALAAFGEVCCTVLLLPEPGLALL